MLTADDDTIPELIADRRAMREELHALREGNADVVRLDDERARREPKGRRSPPSGSRVGSSSRGRASP
jgi:hypothetical protein